MIVLLLGMRSQGNDPMPRWYNRVTLSWKTVFLILAVLLAGCGTRGVEAEPSPSVTFWPYQPATPSSTFDARSGGTALAPTLGPTPTPFTHTVGAGETLWVIAYRYGVSLDDLIAANPGVEPYALSVGSKLVIPGPADDSGAAGLPLPTPVPIDLSDVVCYRTPSDSLFCLTIAHNSTSMAVENLAATLSMLDDDGRLLTSQMCYGPLNRLPPGGDLVLAAQFVMPGVRTVHAVATLLSAIEVPEQAGRYLDVEITTQRSEPQPSGLTWGIAGEVKLAAAGQVSADRLVVLATAYDEHGSPLGYATWESVAGLEAGEVLAFNLTIFSLGPPIQRVEVMAEAQVLP